jgi:hypothetical protein
MLLVPRMRRVRVKRRAEEGGGMVRFRFGFLPGFGFGVRARFGWLLVPLKTDEDACQIYDGYFRPGTV